MNEENLLPLYKQDEKTRKFRIVQFWTYTPKLEYFVRADLADTTAIPNQTTGRRITEEEFQQLSSDNGDVWAFPKAGKASRITNVNLQGAHTQTLQTYVFSPTLSQLTGNTVDERWKVLDAALKLAQTQKAQIFLGPEYFFTKQSSELNGNSGNHAYSEGEKLDVEKRLKAFAAGNKGMLIIPGTILWKDSLGQVRNTALICGADGEEISSHDKQFPHNDQIFANNSNGSWKAGERVAKDFEFQGVRCRYHICADDGHDFDEENVKELHLVSGYDYGAFNPRAHAGGFEVKSDGGSTGAKVQKGGIETNTAKGALDFPITIPDLSGGSSASLEIQKPLSL